MPSDIDNSSATWLCVKQWAEAELSKYRTELEKIGAVGQEGEGFPDLTDSNRGRIAQLRELLNLPDALSRGPVVVEDTGYGLQET